MQDTATFFEELGFEIGLECETCPDEGDTSYDLHIKWEEGNEWASKIYRDVHADAVFYNFYLSDEGKLLRRVERRVSQESNCGNSSAEVAIDSGMDSDTEVTLTIGDYHFSTWDKDVDALYEKIVWQLQNVHCIYFADDIGISELELREDKNPILWYIGSRTGDYVVKENINDLLKLLEERHAHLI